MAGYRSSLVKALLIAGATAGLTAAAADEASGRRLRDGGSGADWAAYGATYGEQHYSPLSEIDDRTVPRLGLAWSIDLPRGNTISQPLAVDGTVYFVTGYGIVHAVEGRTGRTLWEYDPKTYEVAGHKLRYGWGSRGLAWWNGKVYVGAQDGRLIALHAKTGKPVWTAATLPADDYKYLTGAPRVFDGKIIIGFGGADVGPTRGYVSTYDAETGKLLWRWHTVPGNPAHGFENKAMEMAAKTWAGEWWKLGGGGTVWNAMTYDPDTRTVFIGVGNGSPHNHKARSTGRGDNLFLASIVALDADSGTYKWHYQTAPGESWDYTATNDMQLAHLTIGGKVRKVLLTVPKNGFFYVIDRVTGELISAEPIAKVTWATKIDLKTGRPVEAAGARYPTGTTATVWPSGFGAHNHWPMAFSPATRLAYVPIIELGQSWTDSGLENEEWRKRSPLGTLQAASRRAFTGEGDPLYGTSRLEAWDPVRQKRAWSVPTPGLLGGGTMATGGNLVFQGQLDGNLKAYAADTGKLLWSFQAQAPILAAPSTYLAGGRQYVTVLAGISGTAGLLGKEMSSYQVDYRTQARRVLTFAIGGGGKLPEPVTAQLEPVEDDSYAPNQEFATRGALIYGQRCIACHGINVIAAGAAPDLRTSAMPLTAEGFEAVVRHGALLEAGMPRYPELSDDELAAVRQYIRSQAHEWRGARRGGAQAARP